MFFDAVQGRFGPIWFDQIWSNSMRSDKVQYTLVPFLTCFHVVIIFHSKTCGKFDIMNIKLSLSNSSHGSAGKKCKKHENNIV